MKSIALISATVLGAIALASCSSPRRGYSGGAQAPAPPAPGQQGHGQQTSAASQGGGYHAGGK